MLPSSKGSPAAAKWLQGNFLDARAKPTSPIRTGRLGKLGASALVRSGGRRPCCPCPAKRSKLPWVAARPRWPLVNGLARIVVLSAAFFVFAFGQGFAAGGDNGVVGTRWLTGPQLERQLSVSAELTFVDRPFRAALRSVSTTFGLGLVLDRRIDPDQLVSFQGKSRPLGRILEELAAAHDAELVWLGPVGYVAPQGKGWQVLAAAELC